MCGDNDSTNRSDTNGAAADVAVFHPTDLGNARRLVAQHGKDIRWLAGSEGWRTWDGCRWAIDSTGEVEQRAKATVTNIYAEASRATARADRHALGHHALRSESAARIRAMIELAKTEPGIPLSPDALDRDAWLLNCLNGTVNLRTGLVQAHNRTDFISKLVPVEYDSAALCPQWLAFLDRIMDGNQDLVRYLQKLVGYGLTGDTSEQILAILYGTGANGKSTFLNVLADLLGGDYAKRTPSASLTARKDRGIPNDLARLRGARFVIASETEADHRLAEGLIKNMTGSDTLSARFLYTEWFEFVPTYKLFLATNHRPAIEGTEHAIWRRIRLVPFSVVIPDAQQDKQLPEKLRGEWPGILRWAIEGCLAWQREGLGVPTAVQLATDKYRSEMDVVGAFLDEYCVLDPASLLPAADLYDTYAEWCKTNGENSLTQRTFGMKLRERGLVSIKRNVKFWQGVNWRSRATSGTNRTNGMNRGQTSP